MAIAVLVECADAREVNLPGRQADVFTFQKFYFKHNPRIHTSKQIAQIVNSIRQFGFAIPISTDEKGEIIAGHGRLLAAKQLEMKKVPIIRLSHLTEAEKKALRIADNKLTENGEWSSDKLKITFEELNNLDLDFSLEITGFDMAEIDIMLDDSLTNKEVKLDQKANAVPFIPENEVITKEGDIWQLGKHKIICGNSLDQDTYKLLLGKEKAGWSLPTLHITLKSIDMSAD